MVKNHSDIKKDTSIYGIIRTQKQIQSARTYKGIFPVNDSREQIKQNQNLQ